MLKLRKLALITAIILIVGSTPAPTQAKWPPFEFELVPEYKQGKITYHIDFSANLKGVMTNLTFKVPLPEGTRFVEAKVQPSTNVSFDGSEVTFFTTSLLNLAAWPGSSQVTIKDASFTVEVVDPAKTVFTTHTWIAWEGDQPGTYLTDEVSVDITRQPLNWSPPPQPDLRLTVDATAADDIITYTIYALNTRPNRRMWDVKIKVPLPAGITFLSSEAPAPFVTGFDGREVSFSALEMERRAKVGPLSFKVSMAGVTDPWIVTHTWATWKNAGWRVGLTEVSQGDTRTSDILVLKEASSQWIVSDTIGDVPFPNYDLTGVAFEAYDSAFKVIFHTAGEIGAVGLPLKFILNIDSDCNPNTGQREKGFGLEYYVNYGHDIGKADLYAWHETDLEEPWPRVAPIAVANPANSRMVALWVPYNLLNLSDNNHLCWQGVVINKTTNYSPTLPSEQVTPARQDLKLISAQPLPASASIEISPSAQPSNRIFIDVGDTWQYLPGWSEPASGWTSADFDDSHWFAGPTSIGYGDRRYATNLSLVTFPTVDTSLFVPRAITESGMTVAMLPTGETNSVFMRRAFSVTEPTTLTQLNLQVTYEGGFVTYLNGVEVARRGLEEAGSPVFFDMMASAPGARIREVIDLSSYIPHLVAGTNLLAIQVHRATDTPNLSITPQLTWTSNPADITPLDGSEVATPTSLSPPTHGAPPSITELSGKLAVPLDNGWGAYDVRIFSLPAGQEIGKISYARQPNFRFDGQRLLLNREGGGAENVYEYNLVDGTERQVSDAPKDSHPFYDSYGNRVVYGNPELTYGKPEPMHKENKWYYTGVLKPFIFVQCGLLPPHQETEPRCRDIPSLGVLVPAGQMGEIQGTHPVWTSNDMIAYKGCNSWAGFAACGIYTVPSASTKGFSDGFVPRQLTKDTSDIPSDTKGNLIAFTSHRDGNWEAYLMDLNGVGVKNLSNSPTSNDGLPTISPNGDWVAFVSDRSGRWAVWAVPIVGGSAQKLFDLPSEVPWGDGDLAWTNERISWGP